MLDCAFSAPKIMGSLSRRRWENVQGNSGKWTAEKSMTQRLNNGQQNILRWERKTNWYKMHGRITVPNVLLLRSMRLAQVRWRIYGEVVMMVFTKVKLWCWSSSSKLGIFCLVRYWQYELDRKWSNYLLTCVPPSVVLWSSKAVVPANLLLILFWYNSVIWLGWITLNRTMATTMSAASQA